MSDKSPQRAVQLPSSHRTLQQPSQMPLYMAAGLSPSGQGESPALTRTCDPDSSSVPTPSYTEPTPWGEMIPNNVRQLGPASSSFQLNLPQPLMCTSPAPPTRADPFRRGPHAFRVLGGPTWMMCSDDIPAQTVLQLSAREELAVTCLLALHYQDLNDSQVCLQNIGNLSTLNGNEQLTQLKVGEGGLRATDEEGAPDVAAAPPSGAGWTEIGRLDDVEYYEEYLLPIPPPSTHQEHP
ncbi:uncharacterized protein LOC144035542 isoform X1 [Vanacampus margaritifer]